MPPPKNQPNKSAEKFITLLAEVNTLFKDSVTREELVEVLKALIDSVRQMEARISDSVAQTKAVSDSASVSLRSEVKDIERKLSASLRELESLAGSSIQGAVKQLRDELGGEISSVRALIPTLPDYTDRFAEIESKIPSLPPEKLGEDYRNALEALPDGEKLVIDAIEGLREELEKVRKEKSVAVGGGIVGRDLFQDIDLSAQLNGVTKTFNIPAVWNIISVHTSSFPNALRKNIDFTYTPQTITFTDEIDAGTTLAAGQTVVLTVVTG